MTLKILNFGIARDIIGGASFDLELTEGSTVEDLKRHILEKYPRFEALSSLLVAVNEAYGDADLPLHSTDEIALIPPVSGG